jgi:hypothetical protein
LSTRRPFRTRMGSPLNRTPPTDGVCPCLSP